MKKIIIIITSLILINLISIPIYANTDTEETELTKEELEQIIETATTLEKLPNINSRNAIIYDRTSRDNTIWKKRK